MTASIYTAEDKYRIIPGLNLTPPERVVLRHWEGAREFGLPVDTSSTHAHAEVRTGRWLVLCPWCGTGCQYASVTDHRFFCDACGNNGEGWARVDWPEEWVEIEQVLGRRPNRKNRNWLPGETVDDLRAENTEHGVV